MKPFWIVSIAQLLHHAFPCPHQSLFLRRAAATLTVSDGGAELNTVQNVTISHILGYSLMWGNAFNGYSNDT